ncbi:MAG TPA: hypothetical protein VG122_02820 [Gemmata sp.]|jgi:hypothetical protein|nr:hypothetical protein [Gemmata sp.]
MSDLCRPDEFVKYRFRQTVPILSQGHHLRGSRDASTQAAAY